MKPGFRTYLVIAGAAGLSCLSPLAAGADKTAFRITDLDWRDPHVYMDFLGCRDVTDNVLLGFSINGDLQTRIQTDGDGDGALDLSYLIIFDPLDQAGSGGILRFGAVSCAAPLAGTTCESGPGSALGSYAYSNMPATCLGVLAGTTWPYTPAITTTAAPCFVAPLGAVTLDVGFPLSLTDTYLAATYIGTPATNLVNGLMRGFLSETTANNTILPAEYPIVGGQPLSVLLPGGDPPGSGNTNCAGHSDKDLGPGDAPGWYMYFNFTAAAVPYTEPPTAVRADLPRALALETPHPNPFNPSTTIRYTLLAAAPVHLDIYDASGRVVTPLVNAVKGAGEHETTWNGRDARGGVVGSGVYFVRLESRGETRVRKIVLLK